MACRWVVVVGGAMVLQEDCHVSGPIRKFACCRVGEFSGIKERHQLLLFFIEYLKSKLDFLRVFPFT